MAGLTPIHWKIFEKFLLFLGCSFRRETASHRVWMRQGLKRPIIVPKYPAIPVFVIRNNLRLLGVIPTEYLKILKKI